MATTFSTKCLSYIQGKVVSVTTSSTASTFSSTETAFSGSSGKPTVLDNANRRLGDTLNHLLGTPAVVDAEMGAEATGHTVWGRMSDVWVRTLVGRTNLYQPRGVL